MNCPFGRVPVGSVLSNKNASYPTRTPKAQAPNAGHTMEETMQSKFRITRRTALIGAATGVLGTPAVLRAQSQVRLTLGHGTAPGNPRSVAADRMAALLKERSSGRIEMRVAGSVGTTRNSRTDTSEWMKNPPRNT